MRLLIVGLMMLLTVTTIASGAEGGRPVRNAVSVGSTRFDYPVQFEKRAFAGCGQAITQLPRVRCIRGVLVAGYHLRRDPEFGGSGAFFPHDGVALEVYPVRNLVLGRQIPPRLSLSEFRSWSFGPRPSEELLITPFKVGRLGYLALAWVGRSATRADRSALTSVIASIRPA
jgi:hypothetical protein